MVLLNLATRSNHLGALKTPSAPANEVALTVRGTPHPYLCIPKVIQVASYGLGK